MGTEVNGRWWKTYRRDGFFLRGNGHYWIENDALLFHRMLTKEPFRISLAAITGARIGSWHAGKWLAGSPIVKIEWIAGDGTRLSSGIGALPHADADALVAELQRGSIASNQNAVTAPATRVHE